jgi:phosphomannomutase
MLDQHQFAPSILREYDIRGVIGETLGPDDAYAIGRGFATIVRQHGGKRVCVGYDGRLSSPELADRLIQGIKDAGAIAVLIGLGPTPQLYYAVHTLEAHGGIMVSGSHNPPNHNGFKFMLGQKSFFGEDIQALGRLAAEGGFLSGDGGEEIFDLKESYIDALLTGIEKAGDRELKVAWDAGNGAAGEIMASLSSKVPGQHHLLFEEIDGHFPNHHPDPAVLANLVDLQNTVKDKCCDVGLAFDGDGDRVGVVDDKGEVIWPDQLMILYSQAVLKSMPGATIISDVKASQILFDEIAAAGGEPLMWKTGHSLVKTKMAETKAPLAGEMSGHIFFGDRFFGFDDGLYAAVRLLELMTQLDQPLSEIRKAWPVLANTPEIRFQCDDDKKFAVVDAVKSAAEKEDCQLIAVDGVRAVYPEGWWLLRASNTQDSLVARVEAKDEEAVVLLKSKLNAVLKVHNLVLPD